MTGDTKRLVTDAEADAWALYHARWNDDAEYIEVPPADYQALLDTRAALMQALRVLHVNYHLTHHSVYKPTLSECPHGVCSDERAFLAQLQGDA
jgi:hypothetical protein